MFFTPFNILILSVFFIFVSCGGDESSFSGDNNSSFSESNDSSSKRLNPAPMAYDGSPFGLAADKSNDVFSYDDVQDVGIKWLRLPAAASNSCDSIGVDILNKKILDLEFNALLMFNIGQNIPADINQYREFVKCVVTKYGPGTLYDIQVFEIQNEPNLKRFWDGTPQEYAELLRISYETIKQTSKDTKVMLGSIAFSSDWEYFFNEVFSYIFEDNSKGSDYFDMVDLHLYGSYQDMLQRIENFEILLAEHGLDNSIVKWSSEYGVNSFNNSDIRIDEKYQALHVIKGTVSSIVHGVSKMFWFGFADRSAARDNERFGHMGLVRESTNRKLSYYTYKLLTEKLLGSDLDNIQTIRESNGIYIYKFNNKGKGIWVGWNDNATSSQVLLNELGITEDAKVTEAVPHATEGLQINENDYPDIFNSYITSIDIILGDSPVFIEEN